MEEENCIQLEGRERPYCIICEEDVAGKGEKGIRQHLKSKPHKNNASGKGKKKKGKKPKKRVEEEEEEEEEEEGGCVLCVGEKREGRYHTMEEFIAAVERGEDAMPCFPPPYLERPADEFPGRNHPFVTLQNGEIPLYPSSLEECLHFYCNAGVNEGNKPPNIDIEGKNTKAKSLSKAREVLFQAEAAEKIYWAALVSDDVKHPEWWPRPKGLTRNDCVGDGDVPCFNQVIVGSGNTDIGIHIDTALAEMACCGGKGNSGMGGKGGLDFVDMEDPQYQNCLEKGTVRVHVDTYITVARGKKWVIMLPSGGNFFPKDCEFPRKMTPELMQEILSNGGYFFELSARDEGRDDLVTVFTPKGWHHWLLGLTDWHCIFGASRF